MTCIVGVADGTNVWLGADNAGSDEQGNLYLHSETKVWKHNGLVIGSSGSRRIAQLLKHSLECPPCPAEQDALSFVVTTFLDAVRKCLRERARLTVKDGLETMNGSIIVGVKGRLFTIDDEFGVNEAPDGYDAVGSGAPEARGVLYALAHEGLNSILPTALECSERFNTEVRRPFAYVSTE